MSLLVTELTVQRIQVGFKTVEHHFLHHLGQDCRYDNGPRIVRSSQILHFTLK